jgi:hypothetical protein
MKVFFPKALYILIICTMFSGAMQAQDQAQQGLQTWKELAKVKLEMRFDEDFQLDVEYPVFSEAVLGLEGKEITVSGYLVPLEELGREASEQFFILSSLPFNLCFFCGNAGPETVMEVFTLDRVRFTTDMITLRGTLSLNDSDPMRLMYILKEAKQIK